MLLLVFAANDVSKTELHIVPFGGVKIESVIEKDERFPEKDADEAANEFLHARGPSTMVNALRKW
eukprot:4553674-Pleurochrysis_carterae.AAC.1